jgi:hypothetical protein
MVNAASAAAGLHHGGAGPSITDYLRPRDRPMKKWLSWLWRRAHANQPPTGAVPPVKWLRPNENPFGVDVLDCRSYATSMLSTTKDLRFANQLRCAENLIWRTVPWPKPPRHPKSSV